MKKIFSFLAVCFAAVVLLASCTKKYTVDFEVDGGSEVASVKVVEGEVLEKPTAPTKEEYTFGGWYQDPNGIEEYNFALPVTENLVLYAKWIGTLSFELNGGVGNADPIVADPLEPITLPEVTKEGFVFGGWYQDPEFKTEQTIVMPAKNTTAYAKWQVKDESTALPFANFKDNDGVYVISESAEGTTYTVTDKTDTYSFLYDSININAKEFRVVEATFTGTKGCHVLFKLEGGNTAAVEKSVLMTGEKQTFTWVVKEANMTEEGGQRLLIFLNPGNQGSNYKDEAGNDKVFEQAPYITLHSCALYKPIDINETNPNSAIYFETNGGSKVAPISAAKGAEVKAPKNPTKLGYAFCGWYEDPDCNGAEYSFTTMPEQAVLLYAKWEKVTSVLEDTYNALDADTYTFKMNNGVLKIKKTGTGEWQFAKGTLTGADIAGTNVFGVTLKGVAGQVITFKINDKIEYRIECDGTVQHFEVDFSDIKLDAGSAALYLFVNGGVASASEEFEVYELYFTNHKNLINDGYVGLDSDTYTFEYVDDVLKVQKIGTGEWQFAKGELTGADMVGYSKMVVTLKGAAGQVITFKINDKYEYKIECDGTVQTYTIDFSHLTINEGAPALLMFINGGVAGASEVFEIYSMELTDYVAPVTDPISENLLLDAWTSNDYVTAAVENGVLKVQKVAGSEWETVASAATYEVLEGVTLLKVAIKGVAGQQIFFKPNDSVEFKVTCDGTVQYFEFAFELASFKNDKQALYIMPGATVAGESGVFEISTLEFSNYSSKFIMMGEAWASNDYVTAAVENGVLKVQKVAGSEWETVASAATYEVLEGVTLLKVAIKGVAGQQIFFKPNDSVEFKVTCDGTVQYFEFAYELKSFKEDKQALYIMPGATVAGESGVFEISRLEFAIEYDHVNVLTGWTENDKSSYTITNENGLEIKKNAKAYDAEGNEIGNAWAFAKKSIEGLTAEKYTTLVVTVKGEAGSEILFKVNDGLPTVAENWLKCDGTVQTIEIKVNGFIDASKPLLIFAGVNAEGESCVFNIYEMYLK